MNDLIERWGALGIRVSGHFDPYEDPEQLITNSLENYENESRVLGAMATWLSGYGHLLITKKLKIRSDRARRLLSALIEMTKTKETKLLKLLVPPYQGEKEFIFRQMPMEVQNWWARNTERYDPFMLKYGFEMLQSDFIRPKILLSPKEVFSRSAILRFRALYGASIRSDLLSLFPLLPAISLRELSRKLHVTPGSLHPVVRDFLRSGIVRWEETGPRARLLWIGSDIMKVA